MIREFESDVKGMHGQRHLLGKHVYVFGENEAGKTAFVQSLQLLTRGAADDVEGRNDVKDPGRLLSTLGPARGLPGDRMEVRGTGARGEACRFAVWRDDDRDARAHKEAALPWTESDVNPLDTVNDILRGDPEKGRARVFRVMMAGLTRDDVVAACQGTAAKYMDIAEKQQGDEATVALAVLAYCNRRIDEIATEKRAMEKVIKATEPTCARPLESEVLEAERLAHEAIVAQAQAQAKAQVSTETQRLQQQAVEAQRQAVEVQRQAVEVQRQAAEVQRQAEERRQRQQEVMAQIQQAHADLAVLKSSLEQALTGANYWSAECEKRAWVMREGAALDETTEFALSVIQVMDDAIATGVSAVDGAAIDVNVVMARRAWLVNTIQSRGDARRVHFEQVLAEKREADALYDQWCKYHGQCLEAVHQAEVKIAQIQARAGGNNE